MLHLLMCIPARAPVPAYYRGTFAGKRAIVKKCLFINPITHWLTAQSETLVAAAATDASIASVGRALAVFIATTLLVRVNRCRKSGCLD